MDDLEFVQRCVLGDNSAWNEFIEKFSPFVYRCIYGVLKFQGVGYEAASSAQDILQDVFLSLIKDDFRKLRTFQARNGCSLASWLRQVAVNSSIDHLRRLRPVVYVKDPCEEYLGDNHPAEANSQFEDAATNSHDRERLDHLKSCIDTLGLDDKYFLELYVGQGLRLFQLQRLLRSSRGSVDMRRARIIHKLRECFSRKGFGAHKL